MTALLTPPGDIRTYRWLSLLLLVGMVIVPMTALAMGASRWVAVLLLGFPLYITLVVRTWQRLRNAGLSGWWILPLLIGMNFGPHWEGPWQMDFHLSQILNLIPVVLGWCVRAPRAGDAVAHGERVT